MLSGTFYSTEQNGTERMVSWNTYSTEHLKKQD